MKRSGTAAVALMLISAGGFLVFRGVRQYVASQKEQFEIARDWHVVPPADSGTSEPRGIRPGLEKPLQVKYGEPFSKLEIPRLHASWYVVEGADARSLRKGPGHLHGSAMPGQRGNCVIAGHRDLHFRALKNVEPGDKVVMQTAQGIFVYHVTGTRIVSPKQIEVLQPTTDPELHLITCYPFYFLGHAPKRFVVTAELEPTDNAGAAENIRVSAPSAIPVRDENTTPPLNRVKPVRHRAAAKREARVRLEAQAKTYWHHDFSAYEKSLAATQALNRAAAAAASEE